MERVIGACCGHSTKNGRPDAARHHQAIEERTMSITSHQSPVAIHPNGYAIDYHCHLLPGIDDGPATLEESCAMARLLADAGFGEIYCTPHRIRGSYDATSLQVRKAVARLQTELEKAGISLQLHSGREHYLDEFLLEIVTSDPHPLGESNLLLVELPHHFDPEQVKQICYRLTCDGYRVMIAHPERSPLLSPPAAQTRSRGLLSKLFGTGHESPFTSRPFTSFGVFAENWLRLPG